MQVKNVVYKTPFRNVIIPIFDGDVGISYSGGADSAILLYTLLLNGSVPTKIYHIAHRRPRAFEDTLVWMSNKFDIDLMSRVNSVPVFDNRVRYDIYRKVSDCDYLYTGVTQNPPVRISHWISPKRPWTAMDNKYSKFITPFLTHDKRATIYLFYLLDAMELLSLSRSCPMPDEWQPCGHCFHCGEKNWAIAEVEKYFPNATRFAQQPDQITM